MKAFNLKRVIALLVLIAALVCVTALADDGELSFTMQNDGEVLVNTDVVFTVVAPDDTEYIRISFGEYSSEFYNDGNSFSYRDVSINFPYPGEYEIRMEAVTYEGETQECEQILFLIVESYGRAELPEVVYPDDGLEDLAFCDTFPVQLTNTCEMAQNFSVALVPDNDGFNGFIDVVDCYLEPGESTTVDVRTAGYNDFAEEFTLINGGSARLIVCAFAEGYEYVENEPVVINVQPPRGEYLVLSKQQATPGEAIKMAVFSPDFIDVETEVRLMFINYWADNEESFGNFDTVDSGLYMTDVVFDCSGCYEIYVQYYDSGEDEWVNAGSAYVEINGYGDVEIDSVDTPAAVVPGEDLEIEIIGEIDNTSVYIRIYDASNENTLYECDDLPVGYIQIMPDELYNELEIGHRYNIEINVNKPNYDRVSFVRSFVCVETKESEHDVDVDIEADEEGCVLINTDVCLNIDAPEAVFMVVYDSTVDQIYLLDCFNGQKQLYMWVGEPGYHDLVLLGYYGDPEEFDFTLENFSQLEYIGELSLEAIAYGCAQYPGAEVPEQVVAGEDLVFTIIRDENGTNKYYDIRLYYENDVCYFRHIEDYSNEDIAIIIPTTMLNGDSTYELEINGGGPGLYWSGVSWSVDIVGENEPGILFRAEKTDIVTMENIGINIYIPYDEGYDYDEFYNSFFVGISDGYNTWYQPVNELANNHGYAYWSDFSSVWTGHYVLELYRAEDEDFVLFSYEGIDVNVSADETYEEPFVELPLIITGSDEENMIINGAADQINIRIEAVDEDYNSCAIYVRSFEVFCEENILVNSLEIPEGAYMLRVIVGMYGYNHEGIYKEWNCYIAKETDDSIVISYPGHAGNDIEIDSYQYVELNVEYPEDTQSVIVYRGTEALYVGGNTFGYYIGEGRYDMVACVITDDGRRVFGTEGFTITGVSQYGPAPLPEIEYEAEVILGGNILVTVTPPEGSSDIEYNFDLRNSNGYGICSEFYCTRDDSPFVIELPTAALDDDGNLLAQADETAYIVVNAHARGYSYSSSEPYPVSIGEPGDEPFIVCKQNYFVNEENLVAVYVGSADKDDMLLAVFPKRDPDAVSMIELSHDGDYSYGRFVTDGAGNYVIQVLCIGEGAVANVVAEKEVYIDSFGRLEKPTANVPAIVSVGEALELNLVYDPGTANITIIITDTDDYSVEPYCYEFVNEGVSENTIIISEEDYPLQAGHHYCVTTAARANGMITSTAEERFIVIDGEINTGILNFDDESFELDKDYSFSAWVPDAYIVRLYDTAEDVWTIMGFNGGAQWSGDVTFHTAGRHGLVLMAYYEDYDSIFDITPDMFVPAGEPVYVNVESFGMVYDILLDGSNTATVGEPYTCELVVEGGMYGVWPNSYDACLLDSDGNVLYSCGVDGLYSENYITVPTSMMVDGESYILRVTCRAEGAESSSAGIRITAEGEYTGPANYVYTDRSEYMVDQQAHVIICFPDIAEYVDEQTNIYLRFQSGEDMYQLGDVGNIFSFENGFCNYTYYVSRSGEYDVSLCYFDEYYNLVDLDMIEPVSFRVNSYGTAEGCEVEYPTSIEYCNEFVFTVTLPEGQGWTGASITRVPMNDEWEYVTVWDMELIEESQTIAVPADIFEPDRQYSLNLYRNAPGYDSWNFYRYFFVMSEPQEGLGLSFTGSEETWLTVDANTEVMFTVSVPEGYSYARLYINDYYSDIYFADGETVETSWSEYFGGGMHVITMRAYSEETGWSAYAPTVLMVESVSDGPAVLPAVDVAESVNLGDKLRVTITPEQGCGTQTYQVMLIAGNNLIDNMYVHDVSDSESFDVYLDTFAWNRWSQNYYACENSVYVLVGAVSPRHDWVRTNSIPVRIDPIAEGTVVGYCNIHECPEIVRSEGCLKLPAGLTTVHSEAFKDIAADYVIIPDGITTMAANAFDGSNVKTIVMPEGLVTVIGDFDFLNLEHFIVLGGDWSGHFPAVD